MKSPATPVGGGLKNSPELCTYLLGMIRHSEHCETTRFALDACFAYLSCGFHLKVIQNEGMEPDLVTPQMIDDFTTIGVNTIPLGFDAVFYSRTEIGYEAPYSGVYAHTNAIGKAWCVIEGVSDLCTDSDVATYHDTTPFSALVRLAETILVNYPMNNTNFMGYSFSTDFENRIRTAVEIVSRHFYMSYSIDDPWEFVTGHMSDETLSMLGIERGAK